MDGSGGHSFHLWTVLNAVLWILRTGAPWHDLPGQYPPYQTCHRRFQQWQRRGVLRKVLNPLSPVEAMELLIDKLSKTKANSEFLSNMSAL